MVLMYALYEHASGYALFLVKEFEEVGMMIPQVTEGVKDIGKFQSIVKLTAFSPFKSGVNALENINAISEGIVHEDLKNFLETNLPVKSKDGTEIRLGVADSKISAAINEATGVKCQHTGVVEEILRGVRLHFPNFVSGLTPTAEAKAQLGLGHSYSRAKVKFNVNRVDNMIIQAIALLDQLDKDINTFAMRVREWYSYHFPELVKIVPDNYTYARVACFLKSRKDFDSTKVEPLEEIVMDSAKAQAIYDASRMSMGMDISDIDLINIDRFAKRVVALADYRKQLFTYLEDRMKMCAPNLSSLIGDLVGARLISHAGSLTNLAKYPASTVQILGAEKALFRALKTRGNTPKYGLIFHSTFIGRAGAKNKGRISRYLANKCSIASRIDCFSENPSSVFGDHLKQQVEDRLKFYEEGAAPTKNVDVMKQACAEYALEQEKALNQAKKDKKEEKKAKKEAKEAKLAEVTNGSDETPDPAPTAVTTETAPTGEKKKKKKKEKAAAEASTASESTLETTLDQSAAAAETTLETTQDAGEGETAEKKKKKKKKAKEASVEPAAEISGAAVITPVAEVVLAPTTDSTTEAPSDPPADAEKKNKKKKKKEMENSSAEITLDTTGALSADTKADVAMATDVSTAEEGAAEDGEKKKKKKKKKDKELNGGALGKEETPTAVVAESVPVAVETEKKKKKKKKKSLGEDAAAVAAAAVSMDSSVGADDAAATNNNVEAGEKKKKKKRKSEEISNGDAAATATAEVVVAANGEGEVKKKKKKKSVAAE